ncbi:MAG: hypothetical protein WDN69_36915 [Aliidongia sp.]
MTAVSSTEAITVTAQAPPKSHLWDGVDFGFTDFLGAINPLQHIPIVATIYRAITGDTIGNVARVVGDGIYGGLLGVASGAIDVATSEATGKDIGQHVLDTLEDLFSSSKPAKPDAAPATPQPNPAAAAALMAGADSQDSPKLPLLGSAATAGALAAAAPISPLQAPKLAAQVEASVSAPAPGAIRPIRAMTGSGQPIPIDVSDHGLAMMRANSAAHSPRPVALSLPAGTLPGAAGGGGGGAAPAPTPAAAAAQQDFADRMRDGLAKYDALMAAQARVASPNSVDQVH